MKRREFWIISLSILILLAATAWAQQRPGDHDPFHPSFPGKSAIISGVVTDEITGGPIAKAWIAVYAKAFGSRVRVAGSARSDSNGVYKLSVEPGDYLVAADAKGYAAEWYDNAAAAGLADTVKVTKETSAQVNFALSHAGSLNGKVTDETDAMPIAGAIIQASNEEKGIGQLRSFKTASREDGTFTFAGLPSGRYIIVAAASGYMKEYWQEADSLAKATIVTMQGGVNVEGIDFTLGAGGRVSGKVTSAATGLPVAGVKIEVESFRQQTKAAATTDADGGYMVSGLAAGDYYIEASATGYVTQWYDGMTSRLQATKVPVVLSQTAADINFALTSIETLPRCISGVVTDDSTGLAIANAIVKACPLNILNRSGMVVTAGDGTFVLRGLAEGSYILAVSAAGYRSEFYDDAHSPNSAAKLQVVADQEVTGLMIGLKPQAAGPHHIGGHVRNNLGAAVEDACVTLEVEDSIVAAAMTAEDGSFSLDGVLADSYTLTASASGYSDVSEPIVVGGTADIDGIDLAVISSLADVQVSATLPAQFELEQNYPNPFNPSTQIRYSLAQAGMVHLTVFDRTGRQVRQLVLGERAAGTYCAVWDGANDRGEKIASGVYFYLLQVDGVSASFRRLHQMVLIK